jgi:hypothetical protein
MAPRRKRADPYVSPYEDAERIGAQTRPDADGTRSRKSLETAERILRLEEVPRRALEGAEAPKRVFRWVVWGDDDPVARAARTALVLHLRATLATAYGGWPDERGFTAAWRLWQSAIVEARSRGQSPPECAQISAQDYARAVAAAVTRSTRRTPRVVPRRQPEMVLLSPEARDELESLPAILLKELPALAAWIKQLPPR